MLLADACKQRASRRILALQCFAFGGPQGWPKGVLPGEQKRVYEGVDTAHSSPTRDYELNSAPTASYTCFSGTQGQPNGANREAYGRWSDGGQLRNLTKEEIARPWPGPGPSSWLFAGFARSFGSRSRSQSPPGSPPGSRSLSPRPLAHDPSRARDLGELQRIVERDAEAWAREGRLKELITAFSLAAKLPASPAAGGPDAASLQRRAVMQPLVAAYLPLVPGLRDPIQCTVPLRAVVRTGCGWHLAEALLGRLAQDGCELVRMATGEAHAQLWLSLSEAPAGIAAGQGQLLAASAMRLLEGGVQGLDTQECANILLACTRLLPHMRPGDLAPLLHYLTGRLVELQADTNEQHLANALYALGRLHEQCGHTPLPEHLQGLAGVRQRLSVGGGVQPERLSPEALSNVLWACAKLRYADPKLLTRLAEAAGAAAGRMKEQELRNTVWALGRLVEAGCLDGSGGVPGVQRLAEEVQRRGAFTPQALSNLLLGLAHLQ